VSVTITRPVRRRPQFHELTVAAVDHLTDDAVAVTLAVSDELRETFAFRAGQHLTVRRIEDGQDVRRSYSLCSTPAELAASGRLRIGVKQVPGGVFSRYATTGLRPGDPISVLPPLGHFTTDFAADRRRHYAAVVAGSGITPVLSIIATALASEPSSTVTLLYGNRYARSVMFGEELADLKDRYPTRLHLVHVLSREPGGSALLSGRLDAARLSAFLSTLIDPSTVDEWFLCGPYGLVTGAREVLDGLGVPRDRVRAELFHAEDLPPTPTQTPRRTDDGDGPAGTGAKLTVLLDGRASTVVMEPGERVLDAALRVRPELPFACKGGVCSTCRARLVQGEVRMARNYALEPAELAAGYVLTCQSSAVTDELTVDYDG
jgi:ring-1,2-phenylacetyl-CoA epoxidase subunit PaaE